MPSREQRALILPSAHADSLAKGTKTVVLSSARLSSHPILFGDDRHVLGRVTLGKGAKVDAFSVVEQFEKHAVTEHERQERWPGRTHLWAYPVEATDVFGASLAHVLKSSSPGGIGSVEVEDSSSAVAKGLRSLGAIVIDGAAVSVNEDGGVVVRDGTVAKALEASLASVGFDADLSVGDGTPPLDGEDVFSLVLMPCAARKHRVEKSGDVPHAVLDRAVGAIRVRSDEAGTFVDIGAVSDDGLVEAWSVRISKEQADPDAVADVCDPSGGLFGRWAWRQAQASSRVDGEWVEKGEGSPVDASVSVSTGLSLGWFEEWFLVSSDPTWNGRLVAKRGPDGWEASFTENMSPAVFVMRGMEDVQHAVPDAIEKAVPEHLRFWGADAVDGAREILLGSFDSLGDGSFSVCGEIVDIGSDASVEKCESGSVGLPLAEWHGAALDDGAAPRAAVSVTSVALIAKADAEGEPERFVLGEVLVPNDGEDGEEIDPDTDKDVYSREDIRKACHWWMENGSGAMGVLHKWMAGDKIRVLENYIAPCDFTVETVDGKSRVVKSGTWLLGIRVVDDDLYEQVVTEKLAAFSVGGRGSREELSI